MSDLEQIVAEAKQIIEFELAVKCDHDLSARVGAAIDLHEWRKSFIRRVAETEVSNERT